MLDFLIIGAQKSASTYLHRCIGEHPDISTPKEEVRLFEDPDFGPSALAELRQIEKKAGNLKVGVKRPDYLARPEVPARIAAHSPLARLIVTLRNPVDRAVSAFFHLMKLGFIPVMSLNEGMSRLLQGELEQKYPKAAEIIEYGFYYKHISRYLEFFDSSQILLLVDDQIRSDPNRALSACYSHIGVSPEYMPKSRHSDSNSGVYSLHRLKFINTRNRFVFDYNSSRTRLYRKTGVVSQAVNATVIGLDRMLFSTLLTGVKPKLPLEHRIKLNELYRSDVNKLSVLLNRNLSSWLHICSDEERVEKDVCVGCQSNYSTGLE